MNRTIPGRFAALLLSALLSLSLLPGTLAADQPAVTLTQKNTVGSDGVAELSAQSPVLKIAVNKPAEAQISSVTLSLWDRSSFLKAFSLKVGVSADDNAVVTLTHSLASSLGTLLAQDTLYQYIVIANVDGQLYQSAAWRFRITDADPVPEAGETSTVPDLAPTPVVSSGINPNSSGIAYASTQRVLVDDTPVFFEMYALKDSKGGTTNYIKLVDLAYALKDTNARFSVRWVEATNMIVLTSGKSLSSAPGKTPFSGDRLYTKRSDATMVNNVTMDLQAFILKDDEGGDYTYYKLRDLGQVLGFNVGWTEPRGMFIEPDRPYTDSN